MVACIKTPRSLRATIAIAAFAALAFTTGCANSPVPLGFANHFDSARDDAGHGECMSDNAMFNNRQLMVTPNAVENAWTYCVKQSDVWYPGGPAEDSATAWQQP